MLWHDILTGLLMVMVSGVHMDHLDGGELVLVC